MNCPQCGSGPMEEAKVYDDEGEPFKYWRCHLHGWYPLRADGSRYVGISDAETPAQRRKRQLSGRWRGLP